MPFRIRIPDAVIKATVADPCAVRTIAAIMKGQGNQCHLIAFRHISNLGTNSGLLQHASKCTTCGSNQNYPTTTI
jgi:hypothetical protein